MGMNADGILRLCLDGRRTDKGGIGRITLEIQDALSGEKGVELTVLCPPGTTSSTDGTRRICCNFGVLSLEEYEQLPGILDAADCDIYISPQFYAPPKITVPVVSWVHDTWPLTHPEWLPPLSSVFSKFGENSRSAGALVVAGYEARRKKGDLFPDNTFLAEADERVTDPLHRFVIAMFALNLKRSVHLVTCSGTSCEELARLFPEVRNKTQVIYNPVPRFALAHHRRDRKEPRPALLHVSKWEPRKNIPRLIRAFGLVCEARPTVRLRLVGTPVSKESEDEVLDAIAAAGVAKQVQIFAGPCDDELGELYSGSTGFVMPSLYEGFSIPVVEAFAFGLPVAAARRAAIPEVSADAALYFDPENECDMAVAMDAILFDEPTRRRLKENARRRLAELSSIHFGSSLRAAFAEVLRK